jgi:hypothetical protein
MFLGDVPVVLLGPVWGDDEQLVYLAVRQLVVGVLLHTLGEPAHHPARCEEIVQGK